MMWTYAILLTIIYVTAYLIKDIFEWNKRINYISDIVIPMQYRKGKQPKGIPYSRTQEKQYYCGNCNQPCTKEEYESGFCLDCDQLELFNDFEEDI